MITYDEVSEWWDNSKWNMSDYPPSAWHAYCELHGITISQLRYDPAMYEHGVGQLAEAGDGRECECEWAEHERGCTDPTAARKALTWD